MPSPFHGIDTATRALRAFQRQLDVTGHNIANVNTPGYSRQTVDLTPDEALLTSQGRMISLGAGVSISGVNRIRDSFLGARQLVVAGDAGRADLLHQTLSRVEAVFLEPAGSGVSDRLTRFFNSWSALAVNPGDAGLKMQVSQTGEELATGVRQLYTNLEALRQEQAGQIGATLEEVQKQVDLIGQLNEQIRAKQALGASPNDLMDLRDQALGALGQEIEIRTATFEDGTIAVFAGQLTLVDNGGARQVPTTWDATTGALQGGSITYPVGGGRLAGIFDALARTEGFQTRLDELANSLRTSVNGLHLAGVNSTGNPVAFFNDATPQTGAADFALDAAIAADYTLISPGGTAAASDGSIALQISALRDADQSGLGSRTFSGFFGDLVGAVGREVQSARRELDTQTAIAAQVELQIQSVSGVSLDDEMANMLRFQRSYQAAAKALSVFDQMSETLIDMLRR